MWLIVEYLNWITGTVLLFTWACIQVIIDFVSYEFLSYSNLVRMIYANRQKSCAKVLRIKIWFIVF